MKIGVPKEIKNNENRVAITPAGVETLTRICIRSTLKLMLELVKMLLKSQWEWVQGLQLWI